VLASTTFDGGCAGVVSHCDCNHAKTDLHCFVRQSNLWPYPANIEFNSELIKWRSYFENLVRWSSNMYDIIFRDEQLRLLREAEQLQIVANSFH